MKQKQMHVITIPGLRGMPAKRDQRKKSCKHHPGAHERDHGFCNLSSETGGSG